MIWGSKKKKKLLTDKALKCCEYGFLGTTKFDYPNYIPLLHTPILPGFTWYVCMSEQGSFCFWVGKPA